MCEAPKSSEIHPTAAAGERRRARPSRAPRKVSSSEGKLLGNGRGERNPHGQVIDRLAAADVDDPTVAEERPRRRQERAEYDPAGRDRRSGEPET